MRPRDVVPVVHRASAFLLVALLACAGPRGSVPPAGSPSDAGGEVWADPPAGAQLWEANGLVLEDGAHGPQLCLGVIASSLPPQCGGLELPNWDWERVEGEERIARSTYGDYRLHGTLDGERFTVITFLGPARHEEPPPDEDAFAPPCPEPPGGWRASDPSRTRDRDIQRAMRYSEAQPEYADFWIEQPPKEYLTPEERASIIVTARFTASLDRHRAELARIWGGPLCVAMGERSEAEVNEIRQEVEEGGVAEKLGLLILGSYTEDSQVVLEVVVADPDAQRKLDERYGKGAVRLDGALKPAG